MNLLLLTYFELLLIKLLVYYKEQVVVANKGRQ